MTKLPGVYAHLLVFAVLAMFGSQIACAERLAIYGDVYPPFLLEQNGELTGPYAEAFAVLVKQQGIEVRYTALPIKRVLQVVERQPNSCGLALHFSPGLAETLSFVGRVAPVTVSVFAKQGKVGQLNNIEDIRRYSVGTIDIAEVRDLLDIAGINYEPLNQASRGLSMLVANRFDLLLSDTLPEFATTEASNVTRVFTLARFERWVACNNQTDPAVANKLRKALAERLFAESLRSIWKRYGLEDYFDDVRQKWEAIPRPKVKK